MIKNILLVSGLFLLLLQQFFFQISSNAQLIFFLTGVLIIGVPHGAADLLVATKNADTSKKAFSTFRFFIIYLGRLFSFAAILFFFPVPGNILFILFAAYHFGETDLHQFKTNTLTGKLFVMSYGLLILAVILLHHFEDVKPLFLLFESGKKNELLINYIDFNRYYILVVAGILFFTTAFIYFLQNRDTEQPDNGQFLIRFSVILFIVFNMPMLLGFTFYFIVWHSVLSLNNIVGYLKYNSSFSQNIINKQIILYSLVAILGISLFGVTGFMFVSSNALMGYLFIGLAVLTAPHMPVMHDMYYRIRLKGTISK